MAQLSVAQRFRSWRELMTAVKQAVRTENWASNPANRRKLELSLQMLDTVASTLVEEQQAALDASAAKLEEAAVLLNARVAGLALADTPMVFASEAEIGEILSFTPKADGSAPEPAAFQGAWQPEADRGFLQDMAAPARPTAKVLLFTGVQRVRHDQGGAR